MKLFDDWRGRRVGVVGLGVSNAAASRYLLQQGALLTGHDQKGWAELPESIRELQPQGMGFRLGPNYLQGLEAYDAVLLSPGIPKRFPELQTLRQCCLVFGEVDLVFQQAVAPILGITGSSGKTTTTRLVADMLEKSGLTAYVGGNIGVPLVLQASEIPAASRIVMELSSFQLDWLHGAPQGALVTNISENHLDHHGTMAAYIAAKQGILRNQRPEDFAVLNYDDEVVRGFAPECRASLYWFSHRQAVVQGAWLRGSELIYTDETGRTEVVCKRSDIPLPGDHNTENVLAAIAMARQGGASWEGIRRGIREFVAVPHRLEWVADVADVSFYNDSIATSPARSVAGTASFERPVILLAGGYDKGLNYEQWARHLQGAIKGLVLMGQSGPLLESVVKRVSGPNPSFNMARVQTLEQALTQATSWAVTGDVVLLSPACASFDQYKSYEERGEHFRSLVGAKLPPAATVSPETGDERN